MKYVYRILLLATIVGLSACSTVAGDLPQLTFRGGIYSHTVEPLTLSRSATVINGDMRQGVGRIHQFQYPLTAGMTIRLGKNGLGDIAREHGISTIYYADIERWSAAFGIWSAEVVHVYGR